MALVHHARAIEILLVEDNKGDVYLTKKAFEDAKILNNLHVAMDGEEALAFLNKQNGFHDAITPDLILLDINLPKMSGREVLDKIKNDERLRRIPVIILSSSDSEKDIIDMYDLHANSYITKPVDVEKFNEIVNAIEDFWMSIVILPTDTPKG